MEIMNKQNEEFKALQSEKDRMVNQVTVTIEIITPTLARNFLMKNLNDTSVRNRSINAKAVSRYVADINMGRWKVAVPICFDTKDRLVDGQTRCTAVVKANKPVISMVARGLDSETFDVFDCGKNRTHADVLHTLKSNSGKVLKKPGGVSSAINLMHNVAKKNTAIDRNRRLTNSEIIEIVNNDFDYYNEPFEKGIIAKWRKKLNNSFPENILAGFYFTHKKNLGTKVDTFFNIITSNDATTPPVVREFRDMVIYSKGKKIDEKGYLSPNEIYRLIDALFTYYQKSGGLTNRKHFAKKDLTFS